MLRVMRRRLEANPEPKQVEFRFEYTEWWHRAKQLAGEMELCADTEADTILLDTLLDELRLQGNPYTSARQGAILRYLVLNEAQRQGIATNAEALKEAAGTFRRVRGLLQAEDFECWMFENHLNRNQFLRLMEEEVLLRWLDQSVEPEVAPHVANQLRVTGEYSRLLVRARNKQRTLEAKGLQNPDLAEIGLTEGELLRWYFEEHLGRSVVTDIARYARASGFTDEKVFRRTILREFCYIRITEGKNPSVQRH